jgi:hypothetical protein
MQDASVWEAMFVKDERYYCKHSAPGLIPALRNLGRVRVI